MIASWGTGGRMDHAPADRPSDAASTDEWPVRNAALGDPHAPADRPSDAASTDASSPRTPTDTPPTTATWPLLDTPPTTATWPLLDAASIRLAAMESAVKVTVVYESMFGNTRKIAQAISDGVREADPDAQVECVPVGKASPELIKSTDLLIVGGPTHFRHMTTDFSRKRQISREEKAEAKGEPPHELELDAAGVGLREWFRQLPKAEEGGVLAGPHRHGAAFDTRLGSALAGGAGYGIAHKLQGHGYGLVKNPEGFILDDAYGPLRAGEIERAKEWGAQLVRASVSKEEGWAIWDAGDSGNE